MKVVYDALGHVKENHQIWIFFVQHVPVRHLFDLYHVIAQLSDWLENLAPVFSTNEKQSQSYLHLPPKLWTSCR